MACTDCLRECEPSHHPKLWFLIFALCVILSIAMLLALTIPAGAEAEYEEKYRTTASHIARDLYLIYDCFTSIVWVAHVALPYHFIGPSAFDGQPMWWTRIEFAACIYFTFVSFVNLLEYWETKDKTFDLIFGIVVNIVFFAGALWSEFKYIQRRQYQNCDDTTDEETPLVEGV